MRWIVVVVLLALAAPAGAQELPKPTEVGQRALDDLIGLGRRRLGQAFKGGGRGRTGHRMNWGCSDITPEAEDSSSCCRVGSRYGGYAR